MKKQKTLDMLFDGSMDGIYYELQKLKKVPNPDNRTVKKLSEEHIKTLGIAPLLPKLAQQAYEYMMRREFISSDKDAYKKYTEDNLKEFVEENIDDLRKLVREKKITLKRNTTWVKPNYSKESESLIKYVKKKGWSINNGKNPKTKIEREFNNIFFGAYGFEGEMYGKFLLGHSKDKKERLDIILDVSCSEHYKLLKGDFGSGYLADSLGGGYMYIGNKRILVYGYSGVCGREPRIVTTLALMKLFPEYSLVIKK